MTDNDDAPAGYSTAAVLLVNLCVRYRGNAARIKRDLPKLLLRDAYYELTLPAFNSAIDTLLDKFGERLHSNARDPILQMQLRQAARNLEAEMAAAIRAQIPDDPSDEPISTMADAIIKATEDREFLTRSEAYLRFHNVRSYEDSGNKLVKDAMFDDVMRRMRAQFPDASDEQWREAWELVSVMAQLQERGVADLADFD